LLACHPFFTGKQKIIDTAGRIEKFQKKAALKQEGIISKSAKKCYSAKKKKLK